MNTNVGRLDIVEVSLAMLDVNEACAKVGGELDFLAEGGT